MKLINVNFKLSYFENCIFENIILRVTEFDNYVFKNCWFINCNLSEVDLTETIFNECTFLKSGPISSAVLIDSKFSNSKKSIEFEGEIYLNDIFDQIDKFQID